MSREPTRLPHAMLDAVAGGLSGTGGAERIDGTSAGDSIALFGGDDTALGNLGDDRIEGGDGRDDLAGGGGSDSLRGDGGKDTLSGSDGRDTLLGGEGNDLLMGGEDADLIAGGTGADRIGAGEGDDRILWRVGEGDDEVWGDGGVDTLVLEETGLSLQQILAAFVPQHGSPLPRMAAGCIDLTGVTGTFVIGGERIFVSGLERLEVNELDGR